MNWLYALLKTALRNIFHPIIYSGLALYIDPYQIDLKTLGIDEQHFVRVLCDWPLRNTELTIPKACIINPELLIPVSSIFIMEVRQSRVSNACFFRLVLTPTPKPKGFDIDDEIDKMFLDELRKFYPKQKIH